MGCGYTGSHFGAHYPDAICIDGELWDLDSCDEPGGDLHHGGDIACPCCNTREYAQQYLEDGNMPSGNAKQRRRVRREVMRKVQAWAGKPERAPQEAKQGEQANS